MTVLGVCHCRYEKADATVRAKIRRRVKYDARQLTGLAGVKEISVLEGTSGGLKSLDDILSTTF